ncbi:hypothetical protein CEQ90_07485 [Lewinellaceae bacterium SD302]|nr:hypothetical protein CEQ90_07485 [Lewinellaceae bacterium SD302]
MTLMITATNKSEEQLDDRTSSGYQLRGRRTISEAKVAMFVECMNLLPGRRSSKIKVANFDISHPPCYFVSKNNLNN